MIEFVSSVAEVADTVGRERAGLRENAVLWYCYPKKSSGIITDINRDNGWASLADRVYRGVLAISPNMTRTGLRFRERRFVRK